MTAWKVGKRHSELLNITVCFGQWLAVMYVCNKWAKAGKTTGTIL